MSAFSDSLKERSKNDYGVIVGSEIRQAIQELEVERDSALAEIAALKARSESAEDCARVMGEQKDEVVEYNYSLQNEVAALKAERDALKAELDMINAANRGADPCQWERIKDLAMRSLAEVAALKAERDALKARKVKLPKPWRVDGFMEARAWACGYNDALKEFTEALKAAGHEVEE